MAKKEETKIVLERTHNIPLRREWLKVAKYRRAKKAVSAVKKFLKRHMKAEDEKNVKLGKYLNLKIWERGIKSPPHHIKVNVTKDDKGIVRAELVGAPTSEKTVFTKYKQKAEKQKKRSEKKSEEVIDATAKEVNEEGLNESNPKEMPKEEKAKGKKTLKKELQEIKPETEAKA